jgi:hypothetical protein
MRYIENVTGHGYRFVAPLTAPAHAEVQPVQVEPTLQPPPALPLAPVRLIGRMQAHGVCFVDLGSLVWPRAWTIV